VGTREQTRREDGLLDVAARRERPHHLPEQRRLRAGADDQRDAAHRFSPL